jgi:SPP1 gp7 family putative phage head morphogenesis protein
MRSIQRLQAALTREAVSASDEIAEALEALASVHVARLSGARPGNHEEPLKRLAAAFSRLSAAADLGGRLELRWPKAKGASPEAFAAAEPDIVPDVVPSVVFEEAVADLAERDPWGASELTKAGLEVAAVYQDARHGFALAKAADEEVARKVRDRLVAAMAQGTPSADVVAELQDDHGFTRGYSETVSRNAFQMATTAGRFREAERVQDSGLRVGFEFSTSGDSDVRRGRPQDGGENHKALDGLVARADDPLWLEWSPPLSHGCRCQLIPRVGEDVPADFVTVPAGAAKRQGFGSRPDLRLYGR